MCGDLHTCIIPTRACQVFVILFSTNLESQQNERSSQRGLALQMLFSKIDPDRIGPVSFATSNQRNNYTDSIPLQTLLSELTGNSKTKIEFYKLLDRYLLYFIRLVF